MGNLGGGGWVRGGPSWETWGGVLKFSTRQSPRVGYTEQVQCQGGAWMEGLGPAACQPSVLPLILQEIPRSSLGTQWLQWASRVLCSASHPGATRAHCVSWWKDEKPLALQPGRHSVSVAPSQTSNPIQATAVHLKALTPTPSPMPPAVAQEETAFLSHVRSFTRHLVLTGVPGLPAPLMAETEKSGLGDLHVCGHQQCRTTAEARWPGVHPG